MTSQTLKASTISELVDAYERAHSPFEIRVDEQPNFIVMRTSNLDDGASLNEAEKKSLLDGYQDYLEGNVVEAHEMIAQTRGEVSQSQDVLV